MRAITLARIDNDTTLLCNIHNEGNISAIVDSFFVSQELIEKFIDGDISIFVVSAINRKGNRESRKIEMSDNRIDYDWEEEIEENTKNRLSFTLDKAAFKVAHSRIY
jgi:hypothetical protein